MVIAREKERDNIAEYILYMWQMEDLIRANNLDLPSVLSKVFPPESDPGMLGEYSDWFSAVIEEMKQEGLREKGHIKSVRTYMQSLESLHHALINIYQDQQYIGIYEQVSPDIGDLLSKTGSEAEKEIEACLVGLYGLLMLRMGRKKISKDTLEAMKGIGKLIALLSDRFNKLKEGRLKLPQRLAN